MSPEIPTPPSLARERLRLVFFGSGAFGIPTLTHLVAHHNLQAVVTQPDRPAGRGTALTPTPIAQWCAENAPTLQVFKYERVSTPEPSSTIRAIDADAWVVIAFGQKLSPSLLADRFAINLHASLLPRWRGAAPIHAALLAGDPEIGNSVITLADRMDAGLILGQHAEPTDPVLTCGQWHDRLAAHGPTLVESVLARHRAGTLSPLTQDESLVTLAPKLSRADAWVDFSESAIAARRRIHALTPWPGISISLASYELKLLRVEPSNAPTRSAPPGTLVDPALGLVECGDSTMLRLLEIQPAGKKPMDWASFVRGARLSTAERIASKVPPPNAKEGVS